MKLNTLLVLLTLWVPVAWCSNGPAAARVNGEEISRLRLERYVAEYLEDQGRAVGSLRSRHILIKVAPGADAFTVETTRLRLTGMRTLAQLRSGNRIERIDDE